MRARFMVLVLVAACGPSQGLDDGDGGFVDPADASQMPADAAGPRPDARPIIDAGNVFEADAFLDDAMGACGQDWVCPNPVADGCNVGGGDACDGADNDCDGTIDEGCTCAAGAVQSCFKGPPGRRNVGACQDGQQTCQGSGEFTYWGPCTGGITPGGELCDSLDNDCNGCDDDHPLCCDVELMCPAPGSLPDGQPFTDYVIDGTMFWPGASSNWNWTVVGGPCDQLLGSTSGVVSYTLGGQNTDTLTLRPTLSGDYTVTFTADTPSGPITCTFIVHVAGPGLRFELCWDTTGSTDLDLHVHKDASTTPWFTENLSGNAINSDDCYYMNCKAASYATCTLPPAFCPDKAEWGLPTSPLSECSGGPEGAQWTANGSCHNPRLDIDNITTAGRPENVNIDRPNNGGSYRAMVHYYGGSLVTKPLVNVYCGGTLKATYGAAPDPVGGFTSGGGFGGGTMWRVADAVPVVDGGGVTTDCTVTQLHPPGMTSGYYVTTNNRAY